MQSVQQSSSSVTHQPGLYITMLSKEMFWNKLCPPKIYFEALAPDVIVFGDGTFERLLYLGEAMRMGPL